MGKNKTEKKGVKILPSKGRNLRSLLLLLLLHHKNKMEMKNGLCNIYLYRYSQSKTDIYIVGNGGGRNE